MGLGFSLLMITAGSIMRFAVSAQGQGFNVRTTGMVLLVVGVIGALLSIGFWASRGGFNLGGRRSMVTGVQGSIVSALPPRIVTVQPTAVSAPPQVVTVQPTVQPIVQPTVVTRPRTIVRETHVL